MSRLLVYLAESSADMFSKQPLTLLWQFLNLSFSSKWMHLFAHCRFKIHIIIMKRNPGFLQCSIKQSLLPVISTSIPLFVNLWTKFHALDVHMPVKWILTIITRSDICALFLMFVFAFHVLTLSELDLFWLNLLRANNDTATFFCEGEFVFT